LSAFIDTEETMPLKVHSYRLSPHTAFFLVFLTCLVFNPAPAFALGDGGAALPDFAEFTKALQNNEANVLRGIYVAEVLALPVTQQPEGNAGYVSSKEGEVTQFGMAAQYGNVGLLAHNHLSGRLFSGLAIGQEVRLVYGNGTVEYFVITQILQYQALEPTSQYSSFRDLSRNELLSAEQLFNKVYGGDRHVTFQTCIANAESLSWGRLFVIAIPRTQLDRIESVFGKTGR
jgi:hypothetical protein